MPRLCRFRRDSAKHFILGRREAAGPSPWHYARHFCLPPQNGGHQALNELESFDSAAQAKRNLRAAIEKVSARLGNTPTICRNCYFHPEVLNSYMDGNLVLELKSKAESELRSGMDSLKPEEAAVFALLRGRLAKEAEGSPRRAA